MRLRTTPARLADMTPTTTRRRRIACALGAAVAVLGAAAVAVPASTLGGWAGAQAESEGTPVFDFADCPPLPAGMDPHTWRCEVLIATGHATIGVVDVPKLGPLTVIHAEGPLPDGTSGQVFGSLHSKVTAVPGGLTGSGLADHIRLLRLGVEARYAGYADLIGNGPDPGGVYLSITLHNPLLGKHCSIGSAENPIKTHMTRAGPAEIASTDPPIRRFTLRDTTFTVPAARGCELADGLLNRRFGLPSAVGNSMTLNASYTFKAYDQLDRLP
jgi:hypothetical protein